MLKKNECADALCHSPLNKNTKVKQTKQLHLRRRRQSLSTTRHVEMFRVSFVNYARCHATPCLAFACLPYFSFFIFIDSFILCPSSSIPMLILDHLLYSTVISIHACIHSSIHPLRSIVPKFPRFQTIHIRPHNYSPSLLPRASGARGGYLRCRH